MVLVSLQEQIVKIFTMPLNARRVRMGDGGIEEIEGIRIFYCRQEGECPSSLTIPLLISSIVSAVISLSPYPVFPLR
jgi:hypothetical protein